MAHLGDVEDDWDDCGDGIMGDDLVSSVQSVSCYESKKKSVCVCACGGGYRDTVRHTHSRVQGSQQVGLVRQRA